MASLACSVFIGGPKLPDPPIVGSPDAFQTLQADIQQAMAASLTDGTLRLSITQEQLTAFLAARLAAQDDSVITNPQVALGEQEMTIYGRTRIWIFEANLAFAAQFSIDQGGQPKITVSHAELGPLPMPRALQDTIAATIDEALTGYFGPVAIGFRLESIDIASGVMMISGRLR